MSNRYFVPLLLSVVPAKAGTHNHVVIRMCPAVAMDFRFRGNDGEGRA